MFKQSIAARIIRYVGVNFSHTREVAHYHTLFVCLLRQARLHLYVQGWRGHRNLTRVYISRSTRNPNGPRLHSLSLKCNTPRDIVSVIIDTKFKWTAKLRVKRSAYLIITFNPLKDALLSQKFRAWIQPTECQSVFKSVVKFICTRLLPRVIEYSRLSVESE